MLADQAHRPLRAAQAQTVERMNAEAGNNYVAILVPARAAGAGDGAVAGLPQGGRSTSVA